MERIDEFYGDYRFLSNFYPSEVKLDGAVYPTVEHAYQAAKTTDDTHREAVASAQSPGVAKRMGSRLPLRADWDEIKHDVMRDLLHQKFHPGSALAYRLLATGEAELVEGNTWGDRYWGVCDGDGENHLGRLLMAVRSRIGGGALATKPPRVYNRRHSDVPGGAVDVSRASEWGNPFRICATRSRAAAIEAYREWVLSRPGHLEHIRRELRGKDLLCWCKPKPCHGDVLLELANLDPLI